MRLHPFLLLVLLTGLTGLGLLIIGLLVWVSYS